MVDLFELNIFGLINMNIYIYIYMFYIISHLGLRYLECYQVTVVKISLTYCYTYAETRSCSEISVPVFTSLKLSHPCTISKQESNPAAARSKAARLLRLPVRIPPGAWMSVCCECCVLSGRGFCDGPITHLENSYRLWCV